MITPDQIVTYARSWMGTRWRHQGRGDGNPVGIDCAGLLVMTAKNFDLPHEDLQGYGRDPSRQFVKQIEKFTEQGFVNQNLHGAIGIFNDTIMPCHTGIFAVDPETGEVTVVHAECRPRRCVHEEPFEDSYPSMRDRLVDVRLFKGVAYG